MTLRGMAAVSATRVPDFKNFLRVSDICFSLNFSAEVGSVPGGCWWVPLIYDAVKHIIFLENIQYVIFRSIYGLRGYISTDYAGGTADFITLVRVNHHPAIWNRRYLMTKNNPL